MALIYDREKGYWKHLEEVKQVIPNSVWAIFDRQFTNRVKETKKIIVGSGYRISQDDGAIIIGLVQAAAKFFSTIKTAEKNGLNEEGNIVLTEEICHLVNHCLRNDLNCLLYTTDDLIDREMSDANKKQIDGFYNEMFTFIVKLKNLTKE